MSLIRNFFRHGFGKFDGPQQSWDHLHRFVLILFAGIGLVVTGRAAITVTSLPAAQTVVVSGAATFAVTATGASPLTYRWKRLPRGKTEIDLVDNGTYSGVSTPTLTITNVTGAMNGDKFGVVIEGDGSSSFSGFLLNVVPSAAGYAFRVVDLGTLDAAFGEAADINNQGVIAGRLLPANYSQQDVRLFRYADGVMSDVGALARSPIYATALNDAGVIVGGAYPKTSSDYHAFRWEGGTYSDLGTFGGSTSTANDINNSGTIVGGSAFYGYILHAFKYQNGVVTDLSSAVGSPSTAMGINSSGLIVGQGYVGGSFHAFSYDGSAFTDLIDLVPNSLDSSAKAVAVNDNGAILVVRGDHSFRYENGIATDLGNLGGLTCVANDINLSGEIVGVAQTGNAYHAFIYQNGVMTDLHPYLRSLFSDYAGPEYEQMMSSADGINDAGQIVGYINGRPFLLNPITAGIAPAIPAIVTQPESMVTAYHGRGFFQAEVSSGLAVTYQWQVLAPGSNNWSDLMNSLYVGGVNTPMLWVSLDGYFNSGGNFQYRCRATNALGSTLTNVVTLTQLSSGVSLPGPPILTQPLDSAVKIGARTAFAVKANGTYQWQSAEAGSDVWSDLFDNALYAGATTAKLFVNTRVGLAGYRYRCVVHDATGTTTTRAAGLTLVDGGPFPVVTTQPSSTAITAGNDAIFTVVVSGTGVLNYHWQSTSDGSSWAALGDGMFASGTNGPTLTLKTPGNNGARYRCLVYDNNGYVATNTVVLNVNQAVAAPSITAPPSAQTVKVRGDVVFTVAASGVPAPSYQWQRLSSLGGGWSALVNDGTYVGAITASLTIVSATAEMNGDQYRCVATNSAGNATSSAATLTIIAAKSWADLNGDGKADLVWRNSGTNEHAAWLMNGTVASGTASYGLPSEWRVIKAADFDGDGKSDLVWRNSNTGAVVLWQMNGTTIGTSTWIYDSGTDWTAEIFADFNGDGKTDILWHNTVNGQYAFWLMNGGTVGSASGFSIAAGWSVAKAADFNGDGKSDLLWRNASTGGVVMWLQNGITTISSTWIYDSGTDWALQLFGDFNGDGKADILWHNTVTGQYAFWLMDGATIASASGFSIAAGWSVTNAADFNGDGKTDLIWRNSTSGGMVMWIQNGTTTTSTAWIYDSGTAWEIAATKDFNGDGKADILWHNTVTGEYAFWLMNGSITSSASGFSLPAGWALDQ